MSQMAARVQTQFKKTSSDLVLFVVKFVSGGVLGLTFALVMQEALGKADDENLLAFFFVIFVTIGVFLKVAKSWSMMAVFVFDLICVLLGMLLRMYIIVAPGA